MPLTTPTLMPMLPPARVDPDVLDKKPVSPAFISAYRELCKLEGYEIMAKKVEAFVLPAMV